jgi:hypothetical protein
MFSVGDHVIGSLVAEEIPSFLGPRQFGQFSARAVAALSPHVSINPIAHHPRIVVRLVVKTIEVDRCLV